MVTVAEGLFWRPAELENLARVLRSGARSLADSAGQSHRALTAVPEDDFAGANRIAAEGAVGRSTTRLRRSGVAFERLADCCSDSAAMLDDAVSELNSAVTWATSLGFQVDLATGAVTPTGGLLSSLASSLSGSAGGGVGGVGAASLIDPVTMARWRADAEQRIKAALENLNSLDAKVAGAIAALAPLELGSDSGGSDSDGSDSGGSDSGGSGSSRALPEPEPASSAVGTPLEEANSELANKARALGLPPAQLLESSPLHSAIAFGDVQKASTVITLVPGTSSSAEDAARQFERVAATIKASGEAPADVAVVLFSYDAPQNLYAATSPAYYDLAAERLQHLQAGLIERADAGASPNQPNQPGQPPQPTQPTQRHIVAGYSYGATVVSQATTGSGLYADRVLLVASPGVGPGIEKATHMKLLRPDGTARPPHENSRRVAVATSPMDPIRVPAAAGVHEKNPADEDFGAYRLDMSERSLTPKELSELLDTPLRELPQKYQYLKGNPHTEHYFDDDIFTRETSRWLQSES